MSPIMYSLDMFGHNFLVYCTLEDSLMSDALADSSLHIFEDDVQISGVWVRSMGQLGFDMNLSMKGEGIRDMFNETTLEMFQREGLIAIEEHLSVERAANRVDKARDDYKASRGG